MKNNLTGTLTPEVVALPELSVFRLVRSTFSGTIPSPYSDLYWGLSGNLIDLSKMSRLKQLRLGQIVSEVNIGIQVNLGWEKTNLRFWIFPGGDSDSDFSKS